MYERWTVGDNPNVAPLYVATYAANDLPAGMPLSIIPRRKTPTRLTFFIVHGYNMKPWDKDRFAETEFKRLYWQGYQGRFGEFRWPTAQNAVQFGSSEFQAWQSAQGLLNKLNDLNAIYPGQVYLTAHSLGNVVAGEALRLAGTNQVVNTYVAMQGAVSAHGYDPNTTPYTPLNDDGAPDCYAHYWTNGAPCYFNSSMGAGAYVDFYNMNDWALYNAWLLAFQNAKPLLYPSYGYIPNTGHYFKDYYNTELFFPANSYEIFNAITQSRSYALGAQPDVGGVFTIARQVSLPSVWPPDTSTPAYSAHVWHSAEFRSDNPQRWLFWNAVLSQMNLKK